MRYGNKLSREVVGAPNLPVFKARSNKVFSNLASWDVSLHIAGDWDQMIFKVHLNPFTYYDSVKI